MKLTIICLRLTRHSDSRSILTALSREAGRVAMGVPAGNSREARRLRALTMPLSVLTCETVARPGQEILPIRQAAAARVTASLHSHPVKQMMAMFVAETVSLVMRQGARTRCCSTSWPRRLSGSTAPTRRPRPTSTSASCAVWPR